MSLLTPSAKRFRAVATAVSLGPLLLLASDNVRTPSVPVVCLTELDGLLVGGRCADTSFWFATAELRMAAGERVCWWTADTFDFATISGVGPALAQRLEEYRTSGGELSDSGLQSIRGIGPSLASRALADLTTTCARVPAH